MTNESDIKRSIALGMDWCAQEHAAYFNAGEWLTQAARGEIPHGDVTLPTQEKPVEPTNDEPITFDGEDMLPLTDGDA